MARRGRLRCLALAVAILVRRGPHPGRELSPGSVQQASPGVLVPTTGIDGQPWTSPMMPASYLASLEMPCAVDVCAEGQTLPISIAGVHFMWMLDKFDHLYRAME